MTSTIKGHKSLLVEKPIQTLEDLQSVIMIVEEKLKQTSKLVILLFESSIESLSSEILDETYIKLENEECDEQNGFTPENKIVVKEETNAAKFMLEHPLDDDQDTEANYQEDTNANSDREHSEDDKDADPDFNWKGKAIGLKGQKKKEKETEAQVNESSGNVEIKIEKKPPKKYKGKRYCERNFGGLCVECGKYYKRISAHKLNFHTRKMKHYVCPFCNLEFNTPTYGSFFEHKQLCEAATTGILKYECETCHQKFPSIKKSINHQMGCNNKYKQVKRSKPKPHYCTFEGCDYKVFRKERLENHVNVKHLGLPLIKRYSCETCGNAYVNLKQLKQHIKQHHTNIRDFHCSDCGSSFVSSGLLKKHQLIHSDELTQICPYCTKGFKQHAVLYRHKLSCPMNPDKHKK